MSVCGSQHPELAVTCSVDRNHADHAAWINGGWVTWINDAYIPPPTPEKKATKRGRGHVIVHNIEEAMKNNLQRQETGEESDAVHLGEQQRAVMEYMADGGWHTLAEISAAVEAPEASVSARIRDMRKPEFGGVEIDRERSPDSNAFRYRMRPRVDA